MLIANKFNGYRRDGRRLYFLDFGGDAPPPPDYTPVAQASKEAAEIGAALGREQLAEAKRQYDQNMTVAKPVVDAQLEIMRQGLAQGNDYNEYMKSFRPLEQQMLGQAATGTEATNAADRTAITNQAGANADELRQRTQAYEQGAAQDIALATGGNQAIADKFSADINADIGTAVADARMGQTQALNTAARQAARYGMVVPSNVQALTNQNAAQLAAAANNTRNSSIDTYRGLVRDGIGLKQNTFVTGQAATTDAMNAKIKAMSAGRDMKIQDQSLDWAKKLDVAGMGRGLPGASQGAYSVATNAGNSATSNQMAPGQALQGAMSASNGTQMQGLNTQMQGLTSVLGAQGQYAGQVSAANSSRNNAMLDVVGTGLGLAFSDVRLKRDIVKVGDDPRGFGWYEFRYVGQSERVRGVMAHEVQAIVPEAVTTVGGYQAVFYNLL